MNKMLVTVFDTESAAQAGLQALRQLHADGDITLYATSVVAKDADGLCVVRQEASAGPVGTAVGLAVGSLVGLLAGPVGLVAGAVTGGVVGAVRDLWVTGVGLDFVEAADRLLARGKVALVAEVEEEWVVPLDTAMATAGGTVLRRSRGEVAESQFDHDLVAFKAEIRQLESEASHATGAVKTRLHRSVADARAGMSDAGRRARTHLKSMGDEADAKTAAPEAQLEQAQRSVHARIEERVRRVKASFRSRGTKLSAAWGLTKEALAA